MLSSRKGQWSLACVSALAIAASVVAADPNAPAAGQKRDQNPAAERENKQNPERDAAAPRSRTAREGQPTQAGQAGNLDGQLAACVIIGNQKEIAISRQAEQQLQNEEVKKFAQQLVQDHEKFVTQLQQFAEQGGFQQQQLAIDGTASAEEPAPTTRRQPGQRPAQPRSTAERDPNATNPGTPRAAARSEALDQQGTSHEMINIEREVAQQCVQSVQRELSEKQGAEADKCFVGMQIGAHMGMVDKLEVFSKHASPELQAALQQGLQTAQQHLDHAKQLAKQLEGQAGTGERQPAREKKS
jgi:predicted outer membrane protein